MGCSKKVCVILVNVIAALLYCVFFALYTATGKPFVRGFYCNDESIGKPYPTTQSVPTITSGLLVLAAFFSCIFVVEFIQLDAKNKLCYGGSRQWKKWGINVLFLLLAFAYGLGANMFVTDIGKYTIGRLRPHFLDVCKPDWSRINCTNSHGISNYIVGDVYCTTTDAGKLKEARVSFPSGHSSANAFAATFLILYIEHRISTKEKWFALSKLFFQVMLGCGGLYVGLSRVADYMHHAGDVLAGFTIGVLFGVVANYIVLYRFVASGDEEDDEAPDTHSTTELITQP